MNMNPNEAWSKQHMSAATQSSQKCINIISNILIICTLDAANNFF